ncbi:hypothetical protein [Nocardioides caricicola]|uniref:YbaB/EbfC family DNA-binding protein n=1 Tax=Nocardioides caricicola TaxID=634770 RepID=A0ABW0MZW2_9ACTN
MTHSGTYSATDRHQSLSITLDQDLRVTDVRVLDQDRLRSPRSFKDALQEAFAVADGERVLAALEARGDADDYLARAEATLSGRSPAVAPPRPDVSRAASAARRAAGVALASRPEPPPPLTSENGYLTIQRGADGRLLRVDVDPEWLSGARPQLLQQAVLQAIRLGTENPS